MGCRPSNRKRGVFYQNNPSKCVLSHAVPERPHAAKRYYRVALAQEEKGEKIEKAAENLEKHSREEAIQRGNMCILSQHMFNFAVLKKNRRAEVGSGNQFSARQS
jgi:hypothetical protein